LNVNLPILNALITTQKYESKCYDGIVLHFLLVANAPKPTGTVASSLGSAVEQPRYRLGWCCQYVVFFLLINKYPPTTITQVMIQSYNQLIGSDPCCG
jgi:hypothetical protein